MSIQKKHEEMAKCHKSILSIDRRTIGTCKKMNEVQANMEKFMTQISKTVNSFVSERSTQVNDPVSDDSNYYEVLDAHMGIDKKNQKRKPPTH